MNMLPAMERTVGVSLQGTETRFAQLLAQV